MDTVREIHNDIIAASGGALGEDTAKLYSACARPFQSAFGEFVFPTALEQAAALFHGIVAGHAFTDGNKRTGTLVVASMLVSVGYISAVPRPGQIEQMEAVALETADGSSTITIDRISQRFRSIFGSDAGTAL